jgi:DNA-binding XRE family transcriptional regulator
MLYKYGKNVISGLQIRAARAILSWTASEVAEKAGLRRETVQRLEKFNDIPPSRTQSLVELKRIFEEAGIEFIGDDGERGPGVRLLRSVTRE